METTFGLPNLLQKIFLTCGILAAVLYAGTDVLAGLRMSGYRFDTQSAGVLSALGSPTRPRVVPLNIAASLLMLAFAAGVWLAVGSNWALRIMACLLAGNALLSILALAFFPWRLGETASSPANKLDVLFMAPAVILFVLALGFGAVGNQGWFRWFSIGILVLFLVGFSLGMLGGKLAPGGKPLVGVQERTMIYSEMLWMALQAVLLLRV
jgi:hypothetical protein